MDNIINLLGMYLPIILGTFFLIFILKAFFRASLKKHHSRWNTLIDDFSFSSLEFYKLLKEELSAQGVNNIDIDNVKLKEGNIFSSKRKYLRVTWKDYQYDICAAPFGKGFFLSWWLLYKKSVIQLVICKIPFVGVWLENILFPTTYYKIDTASMFMSYAQQSVLNVLDTIAVTKGSKMLTENERKPFLNDIYKR
jgi:hypothetical protein